LHQIAPKIADRIGPATRTIAALFTVTLLAMSTANVIHAQDTGQGAPATGGAQTGAPAAGGPLGQTTTAPTPPAEPGIEVQQFQDWAVRCGQPAEGGQRACEMVQQRQDEQGQTVLAIAVGNIPNAPDPGMLIILPLGIWLPPGVILRVDNGEEVPARIERCERRGCQVELLLESKVLTLLKSGREVNVLFQIYDEQGQTRLVGVPFSLLGFTAALDEVVKSKS
jgi:invasion protein IalB